MRRTNLKLRRYIKTTDSNIGKASLRFVFLHQCDWTELGKATSKRERARKKSSPKSFLLPTKPRFSLYNALREKIFRFSLQFMLSLWSRRSPCCRVFCDIAFWIKVTSKHHLRRLEWENLLLLLSKLHAWEKKNFRRRFLETENLFRLLMNVLLWWKSLEKFDWNYALPEKHGCGFFFSISWMIFSFTTPLNFCVRP